MIMFMREFKVLANAETAEKLRKVLRQEQFEHLSGYQSMITEFAGLYTYRKVTNVG